MPVVSLNLLTVLLKSSVQITSKYDAVMETVDHLYSNVLIKLPAPHI